MRLLTPVIPKSNLEKSRFLSSNNLLSPHGSNSELDSGLVIGAQVGGVSLDHYTEFVDDSTWLTIVDITGKKGGFCWVMSAEIPAVDGSQILLKVTLDGKETIYTYDMTASNYLEGAWLGYIINPSKISTTYNTIGNARTSKSLGAYDGFKDSLKIEVLYSVRPRATTYEYVAHACYFTLDSDGVIE